MTTFALVHGAFHGAWCWERLAPQLQERGHRVVAMDLPCDDPAATFDTYADVVVRALADEPGDDVVVVGHSLAGLTIPLVAAKRTVRRLIYLCGVVPIPGRTFAEQLQGDEDMVNPRYLDGVAEADAAGRRAFVDEAVAREVFFADCDEQIAQMAFKRLRPQALTPYAQPFPLEEFPPVPATYVLCREDRMVNQDWSRTVARDRLGAELIEFPGSHSPFLSRPAELATALEEAL